jgi:sulfite exporter TauE/SafE
MTELLLGFIIGMRHALDADHVSAVATLVARKPHSLKASIKIGLSWGIGHTVTLLAVSLIVLVNGSEFSQRFVSALEWVVGLMLLALGVDLLRRLRKEGVHAHAHQHHKGKHHLHIHRHQSLEPDRTPTSRQSNHANAHHDHQHYFPQWRALVVGIMHGMAGSAALIFIVLGSAPSLWSGLVYVLWFGLGTLIGMASLSFVIALPLRISVLRFEKLYGKLQQMIAVFSIGLGTLIIYQQSNWLLG